MLSSDRQQFLTAILLAQFTAGSIGCQHAPDEEPSEQCGNETVHLAAGTNHTCAVSASENVLCWGNGAEGALGYGNLDSIGDDEPACDAGSVDVGAPVVEVVAGQSHTCALLHHGDVRCWGTGATGALGYGTSDDVGNDEAPSLAGNVDVGGSVIQLAAGWNHTCALLEGGNARCWGSNEYAQLGHGQGSGVSHLTTPADSGDIDIGGKVSQLSAGSRHTCALMEDGDVRCWGEGHRGKLGHGNETDIGYEEAPSEAGSIDLGGPATQLTSGAEHNCVLFEDGRIRCWGRGDRGQLGLGNRDDIGDDEVPSDADYVDVGSPVIQIEAGGNHTCALLEGRNIRCWGDGEFGQLGYGNTMNVGTEGSPLIEGHVDVGGDVRMLESGFGHTCALLQSGAVRCWGLAANGQLGYGNTQSVGDDELPASVGDVPL